MPAPMCGISDYAFRQICRESSGPFAYTQMVSDHGIVKGDPKTEAILDLHGPEPMLGMQLFGSDPGRLGEAAARLQEMGATVVDLNMGCPARKVTSGTGSGSALLHSPELCKEIFRAMRAALTVPFTAKMRWNFVDDEENQGAALRIARDAEAEGVDGLCLHARTRGEGYSGHADWSRIKELKAAVSIPVFGNGDVRGGAAALAMIEQTGCDGVMIGRGAIGGPWILREAAEALEGHWVGEIPDTTTTEPLATMTAENMAETIGPPWAMRKATMLRHATMMAETRGMRQGLVLFRKHAAQYLRGIRGVRQMRPRLMQVTDLDALAEVLDMFDAAIAESALSESADSN